MLIIIIHNLTHCLSSILPHSRNPTSVTFLINQTFFFLVWSLELHTFPNIIFFHKQEIVDLSTENISAKLHCFQLEYTNL